MNADLKRIVRKKMTDAIGRIVARQREYERLTEKKVGEDRRWLWDRNGDINIIRRALWAAKERTRSNQQYADYEAALVRLTTMERELCRFFARKTNV